MRSLTLVLILALGQKLVAQNNIFIHALGDGYSSASFLELPSSNNSIFNHDVGDGFDYKSYVEVISSANNSIFTHGTGDGFHLAAHVQTSLGLNNEIFTHDTGDGFDFKNFNQTSLAVNNLIFQHGDGDGFVIALIQNSMTTRTSTARIAIDEVTNEIEAEPKNLTAYPNPTQGKLTVVLSGESEPVGRRIVVLNAFGVMVYDGIYSGKEEVLDFFSLAKGVYMMYVFGDDSTFSHRFVLY